MKKILPSLLLLLPFGLFAQWSPAVNISPNAINTQMNENMGPCIGVNGDTIHVIWTDKTSLGSAIYYTRSVDTGNTWSVAVPITDTAGHALMPSLAVSGSNIHVVWWDSLNHTTGFAGLDGNSSFYEQSLDGGNTWGGKTCIDSSTIYWPGVAVAGSTVLVSLNKEIEDSTSVWLTMSQNNGADFGPEQLISTRIGPGRSEDQAVATDGKYIHMSWNDNRSGIMQIYYRRSTDMGVTWDSEVVISSILSYTTMVCLDSAHTDVAFGKDSAYYNSWIRDSPDSGTIFNDSVRVTGNTLVNQDELYPFLVRNGQNLHMVSYRIGARSEYYSYSGDGGINWTQELYLGAGTFSSFIALTCPVLHVVWPDSGTIYYMRNPTGNPSCAASIPTSLENDASTGGDISVYPNPGNGNFWLTYVSPTPRAVFSLTDVTGRDVWHTILNEPAGKELINVTMLESGIYTWQVKNSNTVFGKGKIVLVR